MSFALLVEVHKSAPSPIRFDEPTSALSTLNCSLDESIEQLPGVGFESESSGVASANDSGVLCGVTMADVFDGSLASASGDSATSTRHLIIRAEDDGDDETATVTTTGGINDKRLVAVNEEGEANDGVVVAEVSKGDEERRLATPARSVDDSTTTIHVTSGNPSVEVVRGVLHLFRAPSSLRSSCAPDQLPEATSSIVCITAVPAYMQFSDFCYFLGSFVEEVRAIRIVRDNSLRKLVFVVEFRRTEAAEAFYIKHHGKRFSSLEDVLCNILFLKSVEFVPPLELAVLRESYPPSDFVELPSCPVCLERLDASQSGVVVTLCNHAYHCDCLAKWIGGDSACPVCRYVPIRPEQVSNCFICGTTEDLWICLLCGYVGCGRYSGGHASSHYELTKHSYSLQMETQRVWNYASDEYVHRLVQNKVDGKFVELPAPAHPNTPDGMAECEPDEKLKDDRVEAITLEYNFLLSQQLESQRTYFEQEIDRMVTQRVAKMERRLRTTREELAAAKKEAEFLREVNRQLVMNQKRFQSRVDESEEAVAEAASAAQELREQVRDLMLHIQATEKIREGDHLSEAAVVGVSPSDAAKASATRKQRRRNKR